jgi:hypothetical protein
MAVSADQLLEWCLLCLCTYPTHCKTNCYFKNLSALQQSVRLLRRIVRYISQHALALDPLRRHILIKDGNRQLARGKTPPRHTVQKGRARDRRDWLLLKRTFIISPPRKDKSSSQLWILLTKLVNLSTRKSKMVKFTTTVAAMLVASASAFAPSTTSHYAVRWERQWDDFILLSIMTNISSNSFSFFLACCYRESTALSMAAEEHMSKRKRTVKVSLHQSTYLQCELQIEWSKGKSEK